MIIISIYYIAQGKATENYTERTMFTFQVFTLVNSMAFTRSLPIISYSPNEKSNYATK